MSAREARSVTEDSMPQPAKAYSPMKTRPSGSVTEDSMPQP
jgi:hypothetical protein